jgi:hypothetical protein
MGLEAEAGKHVEVTGGVAVDAQPVEGATQVISIAIIKRLDRGCGSSAKKAGGAAAGALPGRSEEQRNASR